MKRILTLLTAILCANLLWGQCPPPSNLEWTALNDSTFTITFESAFEGTYLLELDNVFDVLYDIELEGEVVEGLNQIDIQLESGINADTSAFVNFPLDELYHLMAELSINCNGQATSALKKFYLSNQSFIWNQGLSCEFSAFPLQSGLDPQDEEIIIEVQSSLALIESLSLKIDLTAEAVIGSGTCILKLIHPSGVEIIVDTILAVQSSSYIFSDAALNSLPNNFPLPSVGVYLPSEPFSNLTSYSSSGEWKVQLESFNIIGENPYLLGACLNITEQECESTISGLVFVDTNMNGTRDAEAQGNLAEPLFPFPIINTGLPEETVIGDQNGNYLLCPDTQTGSITVANEPEYYSTTPVSFNFGSSNTIDSLDLPLQLEADVTDLNADLTSLDPNRPGFEATYLVSVQNFGTLCAENASLTLTFPEYVEIIDSENPQLDISGNTASMGEIDLCPFGTLNFQIEILLDDTVSLGTILEATINLLGLETDINPENNSFTSSVEVVGSYDPNDKQVSATTIGDEFLEDGAPLKYTIRFQNTGTFYAEKVVIADTIDADLDLNSLQIISTSHDMQLVREGNVLYFEFDQIFLPDSTTDFDGSIGHVRYEITPFDGFSEGDLIENTAYIYFDFNEPIVTNTVVTEFGNPLSISNEIEFETNLFPNPADQNITISWAQDVEVDRIEIYDLSGRLLQENNIRNSSQTTLDVSNLASGIYLLKVNAGALISSSIFMKK